MVDLILVRYSEIGLKGRNRIVFERKLVDNIRSSLAKRQIKFSSIQKPRGRIIIETDERCGCLRCVFGIASFSPAIDGGSTIESAKASIEKANLLAKLAKDKTFRVSCQRLDKSFVHGSAEIERELGSFIVEKKGVKARMKGFEFELGVEVIDGRMYLFTERIGGQGGLPVGVEGKVVAMVAEERDLLAALLMMKRGASIIPALLKPIKIEMLEKFGNRERAVLIKKISELDKIADESGAKAVVVGQTLDDFEELKLKTTTLRPLIAYNENEIREKLEQFRKEIC